MLGLAPFFWLYIFNLSICIDLLQSSYAIWSIHFASIYGNPSILYLLDHEAGIRGFWKGIFPTLIMVSNPSIEFMIYETSMSYLKEKWATNKQGMKYSFLGLCRNLVQQLLHTLC